MLQEIKTQDQQFTELATNLKCWSFGMVSALFFFFFYSSGSWRRVFFKLTMMLYRLILALCHMSVLGD